jgi:hypothetical protein
MVRTDAGRANAASRGRATMGTMTADDILGVERNLASLHEGSARGA